MKLKIGVIFGGNSTEHEISIITANQAMSAMDEEKYEIIPIYIAKNKEWYTGNCLKDLRLYEDLNMVTKIAKNVVLYKKGDSFALQSKRGFKTVIQDIDIAFPVVHGTNVEDGTLQGYLETIGIPYVGCNVLASALGQDKVVQKQIFSANNLPIVDYVWFYDVDFLDNEDDILEKVKNLGYPVIVKPANLGSSIGITLANSEMEIMDAIETAIEYDSKIVIEKVVENLLEVNCSVLGNYEIQNTSPIEEVMGTDEFLSYKDKYMGGSKTKGSNTKGMVATNRIIPARISKNLTNDIQNVSKEVFKCLNSSGVVRIDYLIDKKTNQFYVNEINTIPGSLSFYLWKEADKSYPELINDLISIAIKNHTLRSKKTYSFETNVLQGFKGSKGAKGKLKL